MFYPLASDEMNKLYHANLSIVCQAEIVFIEIPSVCFLIASLIGRTIFFTHLITDSLKIYFLTKIRVFIKEIQQEIQALMNLSARLFT